LEEFLERHGGNPILTVPDGRTSLLPDGATWTDHGGHYCSLTEPPADKLTRLKLIKQYRTRLLEIAENAFHRLKAALTGADFRFRWPEQDFGPPPTDEKGRHSGKAALLHLKKLANDRRLAVAEIDKQIEQLPEVRLQRQMEAIREEEERERARKEAEEMREIESIEL
jgi:hypothetical protein